MDLFCILPLGGNSFSLDIEVTYSTKRFIRKAKRSHIFIQVTFNYSECVTSIGWLQIDIEISIL